MSNGRCRICFVDVMILAIQPSMAGQLAHDPCKYALGQLKKVPLANKRPAAAAIFRRGSLGVSHRRGSWQLSGAFSPASTNRSSHIQSGRQYRSKDTTFRELGHMDLRSDTGGY